MRIRLGAVSAAVLLLTTAMGSGVASASGQPGQFGQFGLSGTTIRVPGDKPSISTALYAAESGDTILVSPGTYVENIDFFGKDVVVRSTGGPAVTVIDGGGEREVVRIARGESRAARLEGFTIRNGLAGTTGYSGGGVSVFDSSPSIVGNVIRDNVGCGSGIGVHASFSSVLLRGNVIRDNRHTECTGGGGAGVYIGGAGRAEILGNRILGNGDVMTIRGGGLELFAASAPTVRNNVIRGNHAYTGGGIEVVNSAIDAKIVQNVVTGNTATEGGGISLFVPYEDEPRGPLVAGNTIAGNTAATEGDGMLIGGFVDTLRITGNIVTGKAGAAVHCKDLRSIPPVFTRNDLWSPNRPGVDGQCFDPRGTAGNISSPPRFVAPGSDYRLQLGSPAIDRGGPGTLLPARDILGRTRVVDGNGDGTSVADMGAHEYQPPAEG